ncbi:hypothetical protein JX265_003697 [Neoarthrinium moseri]|uniref:Uncharacterized protein n=1 Tax=Neoarthrinium moseri TaxID=1658444 RepID=A0A9P9WSQ7_9PEZI|nr:hypothetical protein JX265_003697 [Neoarthrinium moseri]
MYLPTIIAVIALAAPTAYCRPGGEFDLVTRGGKCPGDQEWCGWDKSCKCDNLHQWDDRIKKCHYPPLQKPDCNRGQKPYCGREERDWCEYDDKNDKCWDDGHNKAFCCADDRDRDNHLKDKFDHHDRCRDTEIWDSDERKCRCPNGKVWRDNRCRHRAMNRPDCRNGEKPYCAKNQHDWCPWDESKRECSDTGRHVTFCCKEGKEQQWCDNHWGN